MISIDNMLVSMRVLSRYAVPLETIDNPPEVFINQMGELCVTSVPPEDMNRIDVSILAERGWVFDLDAGVWFLSHTGPARR